MDGTALSCNSMNGECNCMDNYAGEKCFECSPGHYDSDSTSAMNCSGKINHHKYFFGIDFGLEIIFFQIVGVIIKVPC